MLVALAITTGLVASSNASAAMVKTVVETVSNIQNTFTIMAAAPAQPAAPTAVAGNKSATLTWTAPTNNGAAITSYTVTSIPGEFSCTVSSLSCVITGLTNETSYTFTVTATNSLGTSVQSNQSAAITPTHTPRQLNALSVIQGQTSSVAFSADGRYGIWATATAPVDLVKYDFETKTVVERLTLDAAVPAITRAGQAGNSAFFFHANGFVQIDIDGMYVTNSKAMSPKGGSAVIDSTGTNIYAISGSKVRKYSVATGVATDTVGTTLLGPGTVDAVLVGNFVYVATVYNSALYLSKVDISTLLRVGTEVKIDPGKNGVNFFSVNFEALDDGQTALLTYRSDDQFSSFSGNLMHVARLNLANMSLGQLKTTNNGSDTFLAYSAASWDSASGFGYVFNRSSTTSEGYLNKFKIDDLNLSARLAYAGKPTNTANSEAIVISHIYDGRLFTFSTAASSGWMREYALGDVANEPTNLTAQYGDQQATLTWREPTDLGVGTDVSYTVESTVGGFTCTTIELSCVVTGLTNGTSYIFNVTASNTDGIGLASSPTSVTPKRAPDAPTAATATYGAASATVSWSVPANNGGATISSYTVTSNPGGKTCTTANRTCAVTGLTNGTSYTFSVTAINVAGTSPASTETTAVIPRTVPSAPNSVTTAFGNTEVSLTWNAPTIDGGASISGYRVVSTPGSKTCTTDALTTACTITGLTNGTAYTFAVTAQNSEGSSSAATSASVTPATKPSAPVAPSVTSTTNGAVALSVTAPANGGAAITSYVVTSNPEGKTCTATAASRACTVSGLTNGTTYTFTATATNIAGTSDASPASANAIPRTNPGAPTGFIATFGNASVSLSWSAPADNGGFAISSYKVTDANSGVTRCTVSAPATTCTVTGLTNGSTYSFRVVATNGAALVSVSATSNQVVPKTTPSAPQNVALTAQDGALKVTWSAGNTGGSAITGYTATATPGDFTCTTAGTTCTISGLANGATYSIKVVATNVVGAGAASAAVSAVPDIAPAAPTSVQVTASPTKLAISWSAPADNGGTSVLGYRATATPGGDFCETTAPTTSCEITGLTNGTAYTVKVTARNAVGSGAESAASNSATPKDVPYAPNAPVATVGDGKLTLSWSAPGDGGAPILSYTVVDTEDSTLNCTVIAPTTSCEIGDLSNGSEYSFKVSAKNAIGDSAFSSASAIAVPLGAPDGPGIAEIRYASGSITVSWSEPILDGGTPVTGYVVTASPGGKTCTTDQLECTVSGLTNGTEYTFTVKARNKVGLGAASEPSDPIAPWAAPNAPTGIKAEADEGGAIVSWIAPTNTDFDTTSYVATSTPGGFECEVTGDVTCTVSGLDNGVAYTFTVVATNYSGSSKASAASAAVTPRTSPDAPQQVVPRVVSTGIEVNWIAPEFDGGAKVSFYTATAQPGDLTCVTSNAACVIKGLTQGIDYSITVTATNVVGTSVDSDEIDPVTFGAVPGKPNSVFAIAGPGEMTVSWAAPANTGGSDIAYYVAESTPGGFLCVVEGRSCVVTGLTNGTKYTFTVRAANEFGESDNSIASAALAPVAKPGQPSVVESVFISYDELLVSWTSASASVSAYQVSLLEPNYPYAEIASTTVSSSTFSYIFEGLNPGDAYRVQVIAYGGGANYIRAASAPARKVGPVLFTEYPTVTGAASVGNSLVASDGVFAGLPEPRLTRAWYRCNVAQLEMSPLTKDCVAIKGATGGSYKLTASDLGNFITFGVTATNAYGDTVAYGVVPGKVVSAPILSRPSTFSGMAKSGKTLTSSLGSWVGTAKITYKYQWMRCTTTYKAATSKGAKCSAISGATKATYKLAAGDVGRFVRLAVTATNAYGKFEWHTATSGKVSR
jgi:hypothetical protein